MNNYKDLERTLRSIDARLRSLESTLAKTHNQVRKFDKKFKCVKTTVDHVDNYVDYMAHTMNERY